MATRLKLNQMVIILIIVNQLINQIDSLAPKIKNLNVQCDSDGMKVEVAFDSPFNGIVFSKGFYSDMGCRYIQEKSDSSSVSFKIPADRCGTSIVRTDAKDSKQYENVIIFQNDPVYQEVWDSARLLSCRYLLERDLPLQEKRVVFKPFMVDMLDVLTVPMADFAGDQHKVDCWMDVTKGRYPNNSPIDGPVKVGENLTLAIYIRDSRKRTDIRVKDCYAYDNEESVNNKSPALLQLSGEDGCPLKPKLMDIWKRTASTGTSDATVLAYSTVTAFKFPEHSNVHLTCNVELCKNQCADRCSLEPKGIEGLKEGEMSGGDDDDESEMKKVTPGGLSSSGSDEDGDDDSSSKKVDEDGEGGDGSGDVKPTTTKASGSDDATPEKREPTKSETGDEDEDEDKPKVIPAEDDGDSETETSSKASVKPEAGSSAKDDDEDSNESEKTAEDVRGGRKSSAGDEDDEDDEDSSLGSTSTTTTSTSTPPPSTTTEKSVDDEEDDDEDEKPEVSSTTTSTTTTTTTTTTESPNGRSEDEDEDEDIESNGRKRSLSPSSKDEDEDDAEGGGNLSSGLQAKKPSRPTSASDDEDYDDSQSSRGSSTSVSTTTTTPIPKTPLIIVIKPEKKTKKIKESARVRGGRIETRSRQAVRSSSSSLSSSKLSSSSRSSSSLSRDSCCSDVTSSSSSRSRTSTTTSTTTKSPIIARSSSSLSSSGRSVRRSSRFDEPETGKRSKSLNRSNSERIRKQSRSSQATSTLGNRRISTSSTTTTTTTKRPKRRSTTSTSTTTTTTSKPKTTTVSEDEEDETEAPRKFRKATRKPKRPVRTRKSLTDRLFIPHTNDRSKSTTVAPTSTKPTKTTTTTTSTESSIVNRNSAISTTVRIASNKFSTQRSNPYLRSTLKPATIPPPALSRNSLRSTSSSGSLSSSSAPPKRLTDFDEFKENEALIDNEEEISPNLPKSRSSSSSFSPSTSGSSRRWDGDELFNPFKEMEYEPVRLNSRRNRRSIYNLFVNPSNQRSNYIQ